MAGNSSDSTQLIIEHLRQHDQNHRDTVQRLDKIQERQLEHDKLLLRNTITVEEHVKGAIATNKRLTHVENQLQQIQSHVTKVEWVSELLKPTKKKIMVLITLLSLLMGGGIGLDTASQNPKIKQIIEILNK